MKKPGHSVGAQGNFVELTFFYLKDIKQPDISARVRGHFNPKTPMSGVLTALVDMAKEEYGAGLPDGVSIGFKVDRQSLYSIKPNYIKHFKEPLGHYSDKGNIEIVLYKRDISSQDFISAN